MNEERIQKIIDHYVRGYREKQRVLEHVIERADRGESSKFEIQWAVCNVFTIDMAIWARKELVYKDKRRVYKKIFNEV